MLKFFKHPSSEENGKAWLFVGLGNPGLQYESNRHNIGFMAVEAIAAAHGFPPFRRKFQGLISEGKTGNEKTILLKPQTYMNNSGQSVVMVAKFFKIGPDRIVIFHDELDLTPFKIKVKKGGGNAGHNGLGSIDSHLGTNDYWRVRIGIGHPGDRGKVHGYVLGDFSKDETNPLKNLLNSIGKQAPLLAEGKETDFTSKVTMEMEANGI